MGKNQRILNNSVSDVANRRCFDSPLNMTVLVLSVNILSLGLYVDMAWNETQQIFDKSMN